MNRRSKKLLHLFALHLLNDEYGISEVAHSVLEQLVEEAAPFDSNIEAVMQACQKKDGRVRFMMAEQPASQPNRTASQVSTGNSPHPSRPHPSPQDQP
jgi:hypothetical protein